MINVNVKVNNVPDGLIEKLISENSTRVWLVARYNYEDADLWYYGIYDSELRAWSVSKEIGNGIVLKIC